MKTIPLTQGQFAIVDDEDFEWLSQYKWYANWREKIGGFYAARNSKKEDGDKRYQILMAREILGLKYGEKHQADHANHNTLDNRKSNLRCCTHAENAQNRKKSLNSKNRFKGVYPSGNKWRARIRPENAIHLGTFGTQVKAAQAYDKAAVKYFDKFAKLNFPERQV